MILASIVERETGLDGERKRIAGVFYNRLRRGMKLQSDPTLIYWASSKTGVLGRGLRQSELKDPHPYNSYRFRGLPPSPISNPGVLSLQAVLQPVATQELYFVANGTGGHNFARSLTEHNRNVKIWRRIERRNRQKQ